MPVLADVTEAKVLEQAIIDRTNAVLVPKATETIARGEIASFGHLGINREALHISQQAYPWPTVQSLTIVNGCSALSPFVWRTCSDCPTGPPFKKRFA